MEITCAFCGVEAWKPRREVEGRGQRCCSKSCAQLLARTPPSTPVVYSTCERCGRLTCNRRAKRFCSAECREWRPAKVPKPEVVRSTEIVYPHCAECGSLFVARRSVPQRFCTRRCSKRAEKRTRRRQIAAGAVREHFTLREIAERDGWRCHLCGKRVPDREYKARKLDPTIDHLVPVSDGGDHTRANVALAHNRCNYERRAGGEAQLRLVG